MGEELWFYAAGVFALAIATDLLDGWLARRLDAVSAVGGVLDHGSDALFVTVVLGAFAMRGDVPVVLCVLIPAAFVQYAIDSRIWKGLALRASFLGRWNGIGYFVLVGIAIAQSWQSAVIPAQVVSVSAWLLVVSTLLSMGDRLIAVLSVRN